MRFSNSRLVNFLIYLCIFCVVYYLICLGSTIWSTGLLLLPYNLGLYFYIFQGFVIQIFYISIIIIIIYYLFEKSFDEIISTLKKQNIPLNYIWNIEEERNNLENKISDNPHQEINKNFKDLFLMNSK